MEQKGIEHDASPHFVYEDAREVLDRLHTEVLDYPDYCQLANALDTLHAEMERLQKERDEAVEQNRFRKSRPLTAILTCGVHGYDDYEDFWCPICHQHLGTHKGFATVCQTCGQAINGMPKWRGLED